MRNLVLLFSLVFFIWSCNNNSSEKTTKEDSCCNKQEVSSICKNAISVEELNKSLDEFVDKEVTVCGFCSHVCNHSGKNLFLESKDNPEDLIVCKTGEKIEKFDKSLEGESAIVIRYSKSC